MVHLSIMMLPESGSNQYAYNFADLLVRVRLGREFKLKEDYSFMVYNENLRLMMGDSSWRHKCWHNAWRSGRTFSMTMHGYTLWMPGKYFFLMATRSGGCVIRFDLELDEKCRFTVGAPRSCEPLSDEDILAHQVFESSELWNGLCHNAGVAQLQRKMLEWLKLNAANSNGVQAYQGGGDATKYNLLVTKDWGTDIDWYCHDEFYHVAYRYIPQMLIMCIPGLKIRIGDCSEFYRPEEKNPYRMLDAFFDRENPFYDYTFNMEDHVDYWLWLSPYKDKHDQPDTFVYVLYNVIALDDVALNRLHQVLQEERHYVIMCDYKETADDMMEEPALEGYYSEANCLELENATPEEVIHRTLYSRELDGLKLTPAAVDKVCRLLVEESKRRNLGHSGYYANRLSELKGRYACDSDDEIVIDAADIDKEDFL